MAIKRYSQTDMHFTERRRMERPLLWLVWLSAAIFCMVEQNFFYLFITTVGCGICFMAAAKNLEISFRRLFINIAAIAAIAWIIFEHKSKSFGIMFSIGHFIMLMQLCKLFEQKNPFDYILTQLLSLFLIIIAGLLCADLWFALAVLVYIFLALYVAMVFTIKRSLDKAAAIKLPGEDGPLSPEKLTWNALRNWPGKPLRRVLLTMGTLSLGMGFITFLIAPRTAKNIFASSGIDSVKDSSNDIMQLGLKKQVYLSNKIVYYVNISRNGKRITKPAESSMYLRDNLLIRYSDSTWRAAGYKKNLDVSDLPPLPENLKSKLVRHEISCMETTSRSIAAPYPTVMLKIANAFSTNSDLLYHLDGPPENNMRYSTESFACPLNQQELEYVRLIEGPDNGTLASVSLPPQAVEDIKALAEEWAADLLAKRLATPDNERGPVNTAIAKRISQRLGEKYPYTLDLTDADPNRDGVEDFLFHMQKGHCEYFSSALAVMCTLLDIPARIATGYRFEEFDRNKSAYVVRQRDAHAWAEVYSPETGWAIVDPSPAVTLKAEETNSFLASLKQYWQNIQMWWHINVVGFDSETQDKLQDKLRNRTNDLSDDISGLGRRLLESLKKLLIEGTVDRLLVQAFIWFLIISGSIAVLMIVRSILFVYLVRNTSHGKAFLRRMTVMLRLMKLFERRGLFCRRGMTLREWSQAATEKFHLPGEKLSYIVELQYQWRWGDKKPTEQQFKQANDYCREIEEIVVAKDKRKSA